MKLVVDQNAIAWAPSSKDRQILEREFPGPGYVVQLHARKSIPRVLHKDYAPYAFRGVTKNATRISHVFADETETPRSIAWLMAHELSHQEIARHPWVAEHFHALRPNDDHVSDGFHQIDPEELHCDEVATRAFGERLDRAWWRSRLPAQYR